MTRQSAPVPLTKGQTGARRGESWLLAPPRSSREQASLAPRNLGLRVVVAQSIARIHDENLVDHGIRPLVLVEPKEAAKLDVGATLKIRALHDTLREGRTEFDAGYEGGRNGQGPIRARHRLSPRHVEILLAGGSIPWMPRRPAEPPGRKIP